MLTVCAMIQVWKSEDSLQVLAPSFHPVGLRIELELVDLVAVTSPDESSVWILPSFFGIELRDSHV